MPATRHDPGLRRLPVRDPAGSGVLGRIREAAGEERIELALRWSVEESELNRLPWEMMRGPDGYLVRERAPEVAITRIVALPLRILRAARRAEDAELIKPVIAPRVLFVGGADPSDPDIRWGAEYLGMLRHLEHEERGLLSKLLLRASPNDVAEAIERFKPSVVHFICHGASKGSTRRASCCAATTTRNAARSNHSPPCSSRTSSGARTQRRGSSCSTPATREQPPAGLRLRCASSWSARACPSSSGCGAGLPMASAACTRRFYEALLEDRAIVSATADGRREGFLQGGDPDRNADWSFPCVFSRHRVHPELKTDPDQREAARRNDDIAPGTRILNDPPVFCDRFDIFKAAKHVLEPGNDRAVLVVREPQRRPEGGKFGKHAAPRGARRPGGAEEHGAGPGRAETRRRGRPPVRARSRRADSGPPRRTTPCSGSTRRRRT